MTEQITEQRDDSIAKSVLKNVIPAMIAMLMVLVYNLADMFFVGRTGDPLQVAAVSFAAPLFLIYLALTTIFGMGGASVISRSIGRGDIENVKKVSSFCFWGTLLVGCILSVVVICFSGEIATMFGSQGDTHEMVSTYMWILALSGPFIAISNTFASVIRGEGKANKAMQGMLIGNVVNLVLDPIFISVLGFGVVGAAIATVIGNVCGCVYYLAYLFKGDTLLSYKPKDFTLQKRVVIAVLIVGIPACLDTLLMSVAQGVVNGLTASYGDLAVAGMGVAMKVSMIATLLCVGFGQGVQPILGFCIGSKNLDKFKKIMRFSVLLSFALSAVMTLGTYLFLPQIISAFLTDVNAYDFALTFAMILMTCALFNGVFFVLLNALQAAGAGMSALIVNVSRQGIVCIPMIYLCHSIMGINGIAWSQSITHYIALGIATILYFIMINTFKKRISNQTVASE